MDLKIFKPLGDRVLVKPDSEKKEQTISGLFIPDTAKEKPLTGEVMTLGPGRRDRSGKVIPIDLKVGDKIYFGKFSGADLTINEEDFLLIHEDEILGVAE